MEILYTPNRAWLGDVIPYAENGLFYLYYLNDRRYAGVIGKETTWDLVITKDFVHFEEKGTVLPIGTRAEQDNSVYTGSVLKDHEGLYHIFYTGQNSYCERYADKDGVPVQVIMHAVSRDLLSWTKIPDQSFSAESTVYTQNDWRDPFVFWDEQRGKYTMLLAAVKKNGSYRHSGCTLMAHSKDLASWEIGETLYEPEMYLTHECPDLFKLNEKWYLAFSTFTDKFLTHYRISDSPNGPWRAPVIDSWDGRAYYAAKTAENNGIRYAFGWIPTKAGNSDFGRYEWGGTLVVHELVPQADGTLYVKLPDTIYDSLKDVRKPKVFKTEGIVESAGEDWIIDAFYQPGYLVFDHLPAECMIEGEIEFSEGIRSFGLALHQSDDLDDGYFYKVEPYHQRLAMDMWPRRQLPQEQVNLGGDIPMQAELERALPISDDRCIRWKVLVDRDCVVVYVNDQVAMSSRIYNLLSNPKWGFFAIDGRIRISDVKIKVR